MIDKIKALFVKYREIIVYILVGGMTTVVSWGCKFLFGAIFYPGVTLPTVAQNTVLNIVENVSGILFAYFPNRKWVFQSKDPDIGREFLGFVGSRLGTWGLSYLLNLPYSVLAASLLVGQAVCGVVGALLLSALRRRFGILE